MQEDQQAKHSEDEEGVIILDPKMKEEMEKAEAAKKEKLEKMRAVNGAINEAIKKLQEEHGLKLYVAAVSDELDEMGVWKSNNITQLEEMGFSKLVGNQF